MEPKVNVRRDAELRDLLGAFALGAVDATEAADVRSYLATHPESRQELAELATAVALLPETVAPIEPPAALRGRIAAAIQAEPERGPAAWGQATAPSPVPAAPARPPQPMRRPALWSRATPWAATAAALLVVAVGLLLWNLQLRQELGAVPPAQTVALAPTDLAPNASGEVRYQPENRLLLLDVRDLPPLPVGKVYEVWLIGPDGAPVPSGTFDTTTAQHAIIADRSQYTTLAITAEPGPLGTAKPTGEIVAKAAL